MHCSQKEENTSAYVLVITPPRVIWCVYMHDTDAPEGKEEVDL